MPTYVYETIPSNSRQAPRRFEIFQHMSDPTLIQDPDTGESVKLIITGGNGIKLKGLKRSTVVDKTSAAATACGCATGRPRGHRAGFGHNH